MHFVEPLWLIGTLPWAAVLIAWMLRRPTSSAVPYLQLWHRQQATARTRRAVRSIPPSVWLIFAATLLAILAAAQPVIGRRSVIARVLIANLVHAAGVASWLDRLGETLHSDSIDLHVQKSAATLPAENQMERFDADVIITDQPIASGDVMVIHTNAVEAMDVASAAFADDPAEWMISLQNHSATGSATLTLAAGQSVASQITLPPIGQTRTYFLPAIGLGFTPTLSIETDDGVKLVKPRKLESAIPAPLLVPLSVLDPSVERFLAAYARLHPPAPDSKKMMVGATLPASGEALWIPPTTQPALAATNIVIIPHAITRHFSPKTLAGGAISLADPPPADWTVVARAEGRPMLAVREKPTRQVWLGFSAGEFEQREDFVILLADIVGWLSHADAARVTPTIDPATSDLPNPQAVAVQVEQRVGPRRNLFPVMGAASLGMLAIAGMLRGSWRGGGGR